MIQNHLSVAHELTRMLFAFRRDGLLETVGPAGTLSFNFVIHTPLLGYRCEYHEYNVRMEAHEALVVGSQDSS